MKKLLVSILVIAMIASLAACGKKEENPSGGSTDPTKAAEVTEAPETTKPAETTTPEPTVTAEPVVTAEPEATAEPTATPDPTEAPEEPDVTVDFDAIVGNWVEEESVTGWDFEIHSDGSWIAYMEEYEDYGDTVIRAYGVDDIPYVIDLRESSGEIWTSLCWDWNEGEVDRLYAMDLGDGGVWYERDDEFEEFPEYVPGDEYCGNYQSNRASMEVTREGAGAFIFTIIWAESAEEWFEWQYWTNYDEESNAFHTNGGNVKWKCSKIGDEEENREVLSTNEEADFSPYENLMFWIDQTGDIEGEMQFEKIPSSFD